MSEKLAIIDLDLGAKLVGNDKSMAKELLEMLIDTLPEHLNEITTAYEANNLDALVKATHKLHGATCYTGTPRLKASAAALEQAAKQKQTEKLQELFKQLVEEINMVLNYPS